MDQRRAEALFQALQGQKVGGWLITELIGHGGSAAVFAATQGAKEAAVKVIDPDLITEFGEAKQRERIDLEAKLIGHKHPNLVKILEATKCERTGHLYVAMERLRFATLSGRVDKVPPEAVGRIIEQIASAAEFLDRPGICHRDIKPDNVMVSDDFSHSVLMDLGILSYFEPPAVPNQDPSGERFIGTARYCPSEFVRNRIARNPEGFRAVTFYQLGALLHDMIMGRRMFDEVAGPYALLLDAIDNTVPVIESVDVAPHLVHLARDCLRKRPDERWRMVTWDRFRAAAPNTSLSARARVRAAIEAAGDRKAVTIQPAPFDRAQLQALGRHIRNQLREACDRNPELPSPSVDIDLTATGVRACAVFESAPDLGLLRGIKIRFDATPINSSGEKETMFTLDAVLTWAGGSQSEEAAPPTRVCLIREPECNLLADLEDFLYRAIGAAMLQPDEASGLALRMDG